MGALGSFSREEVAGGIIDHVPTDTKGGVLSSVWLIQTEFVCMGLGIRLLPLLAHDLTYYIFHPILPGRFLKRWFAYEVEQDAIVDHTRRPQPKNSPTICSWSLALPPVALVHATTNSLQPLAGHHGDDLFSAAEAQRLRRILGMQPQSGPPGGRR